MICISERENKYVHSGRRCVCAFALCVSTHVHACVFYMYVYYVRAYKRLHERACDYVCLYVCLTMLLKLCLCVSICMHVCACCVVSIRISIFIVAPKLLQDC